MVVKSTVNLWIIAGALLFGPRCAASSPDDSASLVFATELVRFEPGDGAGYGQDDLPGIVLGAPGEASESAGSLHVLSLGVGG